jgi:cell division septation protein DedD
LLISLQPAPLRPPSEAEQQPQPQAPPAPPAPAKEAEHQPNAPKGGVQVQFGAFSKLENAQAAANKLRGAGFNPVCEKYKNMYRVVLNNVDAKSIPNLKKVAKSLGFNEILVREDP